LRPKSEDRGMEQPGTAPVRARISRVFPKLNLVKILTCKEKSDTRRPIPPTEFTDGSSRGARIMSKKWLILLAVSFAAGGLAACAKKDTASEATVEETAEDAAAAMDEAMDDASDAMDAAADDMGSAMDAAADDMGEAMDDAADAAGEMMDDAEAAADDMMDDAEAAVEEATDPQH